MRELRKQALNTDLVEVTDAKTACGSRSPVFAIPSVVWLSVGGSGPSEASCVSAATSRSIAACDQAKIKSEGELRLR